MNKSDIVITIHECRLCGQRGSESEVEAHVEGHARLFALIERLNEPSDHLVAVCLLPLNSAFCFPVKIKETNVQSEEDGNPLRAFSLTVDTLDKRKERLIFIIRSKSNAAAVDPEEELCGLVEDFLKGQEGVATCCGRGFQLRLLRRAEIAKFRKRFFKTINDAGAADEFKRRARENLDCLERTKIVVP